MGDGWGAGGHQTADLAWARAWQGLGSLRVQGGKPQPSAGRRLSGGGRGAGADIGPQIRQLRRGMDVAVGTPGRVMDLMNRGVLDLGMVRHEGRLGARGWQVYLRVLVWLRGVLDLGGVRHEGRLGSGGWQVT